MNPDPYGQPSACNMSYNMVCRPTEGPLCKRNLLLVITTTDTFNTDKDNKQHRWIKQLITTFAVL
jgi:hypothetical protein